jgi:hypothetical protein
MKIANLSPVMVKKKDILGPSGPCKSDVFFVVGKNIVKNMKVSSVFYLG